MPIYMLYFICFRSHGDENLLTCFSFLRHKAIRTAGRLPLAEEFRIIDCDKIANFISWQLNCQLVTS